MLRTGRDGLRTGLVSERRKLSESLANVGREVLFAALTGLHMQDDTSPPPLPKGLREYPQGELTVPMPDSWEEVLRDLARSLNGGTVSLVGQQRLYQLWGTGGSPGKVGPEAGNEAIETVSEAIRNEISAQGHSLTAAGQTCSPKVQVDPIVLKELVLQVAAHMSVGPGVEVALSLGLPPNLWQPIFTICIGDGQVRVLTFAFIGTPVTGDRPDRKRTPFCLRIATGDLVRVAARNAYSQHRASQARREASVPATRSAAATVFYAAEAVPESVQTTWHYIVGLEDDLFGAIGDGRWADFLRDTKARSAH